MKNVSASNDEGITALHNVSSECLLIHCYLIDFLIIFRLSVLATTKLFVSWWNLMLTSMLKTQTAG